MPTVFARAVRAGLAAGVAEAMHTGDTETDFRAAVCRFEDELFARYPGGHQRMELRAAEQMLGEIFNLLDRTPPRLALVGGFSDPRVGGYADVSRHRITIERGHLYRFLVLHEAAHLIVPKDRRHGPGFTYVLQLLYRSFIAVPEESARRLLLKHGLPAYLGSASPIAA